MRIRYWIGALLLLSALCCSATSQAATVPPGSFLTRSISNPEDLAKLIETDKRVAQRYSRHFGMSAKELAGYVRANLRVGQLKTSGRYTTYFITKGDRILVHSKHFKAGRKVLVGPDGKPVMDIACGNPLVKSLPKVVAKAAPPPPPKVEAAPKPVEPPAQPVVAEQPVLDQPAVVAELPTTPPEFETPVEEAPQMAQAIQTPEPEVAVLDMPATEFSSAASLLSSGIIPGLLTAGAASAVFGGGGGSTVPEPSSLIALGSSVTAFAALAVRRRRRIR